MARERAINRLQSLLEGVILDLIERNFSLFKPKAKLFILHTVKRENALQHDADVPPED